MSKNLLRKSNVSENYLISIYQQQYDDIFSQILIIDQFQFFTTLKKQVMVYLEISNKQSSKNLLKKVEEIFIKKYLEEKEIVYKDFEVIKELPTCQIDYLDRLNCIIHCPKCKEALHTCGLKFILYGDYVFCLSCMKVYNERQVNMYCEECDEEYYTQLREITNYNRENFFHASISDYHCRLDYEEKIQCPKCDRDLFVDIKNKNNYDKIEELICLNCNLIFNVNLFVYKCKKCGINFRSEVKIFNSFYNKKNDFITKVHTLCDKKFASPKSTINKGCDCNLNYIMKYKHSDGGVLYIGERNAKKIILCDLCYQIFDYNNYIFSCPLCNKSFNPFYIDTFQRISKGYESSSYPNKEYINCKYHRRSAKNSSYLQKNKISKKIPVSLKLQQPNNSTSCISEGNHCSSLSKENLKEKNNFEKPYSTRTKLLKNNYNKIKIRNILKTSKEKEKEIFKNKIYNNQPYKNSNQRINIKIENFYNNYVPIIQILRKNKKIKENIYNSKCVIRRNYEIMNTSPRVNKTNNATIFSKNSTNIAFLKRSTTENSKISCDSENINRNKYITQNKKISPYFNYTNVWDSRKLYSISFTDGSSKKKYNNYFNNHLSNNYGKTNSSFREQQKRNSADNDFQKRNNIKSKNKKRESAKFNLSGQINKIRAISKADHIKEKKEEQTKNFNHKKIINFDNNLNNIKNKSNINKNIINILTLSTEKRDDESKDKNKKYIKGINPNCHFNKKLRKLKTINNNNIFSNKNNSIKKVNSKLSSLGHKLIILNKKKIKNIPENIKDIPNNHLMKNFNSEDYNILNIIGEGTFSQIFLVENFKTHERYALKKMTATKIEELEKKKQEFELVMKLAREDEKLNLVRIYGIQIKKLDKFNMVLYILMEAASSDWETELKNRYYNKKFYSEEELKNIISDLIRTFASLQKKGICHRDVKPQNILCFGNGVYKLTDFGEAKYNKNMCKCNFNKYTSAQTLRGTELYMSPVLFNALRQSLVEDLEYNAFKSDVFSLGLCFLLSCSLSYKPLYEMREINNMDNVKLLIEKYLKNKYSKNIFEIIFTMLQIEEKYRPDFIELESIIKKFL